MAPRRTPNRAGLTPAQLIVALAFLLFLLAFLAPALARVRDAAARAQSQNNLKQLALAIHNAHDVYNGFPPVVGEFQNKTGTLHFFILPFIEQQNLYNGANAVWDNDTWGKHLDVFVDRRDATAPPGGTYRDWLATTNYPANWMVFGDGKGGGTFAQITDGTSNTLMYAQRFQVCRDAPTAWGYPSVYTWAPMFAYYNQALFQVSPRPDQCDPERPQAIGGAINVAMCDGSVRSVSDRISAQTWANVCDPADGNVIGDDF
jgi:prepilin-type processing-associated H-X9-DG protein